MLVFSYRIPSAASLEIHPGDAAPFLLWGREGSTLLLDSEESAC
jgi:hypothetical protein